MPNTLRRRSASPSSSPPFEAIEGEVEDKNNSLQQNRNLAIAPWTQQTIAPWTARFNPSSASVVIGNNIIFTGGEGVSAYLNDAWLSSDSGISWTQKTAAAPWIGRIGHSAVVVNGNIILLAGQNSNHVLLNDVWLSVDSGASWIPQTLAAQWLVRAGQTSVVIGNNIIMMCGFSVSVDFHDVWISGDSGLSWTQKTAAAPFSARDGHSSVVVGNNIVLFGGINSNGILSDVWMSADSGSSWVQQTSAAPWGSRYWFSTVVIGSSISMMGGNDGKVDLNDIWSSADSGVSWTQQTAAAQWSVRNGQNSVLVGNSIVLFGGKSNSLFNSEVWTSLNTPSTTTLPPVSSTTSSAKTPTSSINPTIVPVVPSTNSQQQTGSLSFPSVNFGATVGGTAGGILLIIAVLLFVFFFFKNKKSKSSTEKDTASNKDVMKPPAVIIQQEDESVPVVPSNKSITPTSYKVFFMNSQTNERVEQIINSKETLGIVKRKLLAQFPQFGKFESIFLTLGTSLNKLPNETFMDDQMFFDGMTIYINYVSTPSLPRIVSVSSSKPRLLSITQPQLERNSDLTPSLPVVSSSFQQTKPLVIDTNTVFQALGERKNLSSETRKEAKRLILNYISNGSGNSLGNFILSRLKEDGSFHIKSLSEMTKVQPWFSVEGDDSMFEVGASKSLQRNSFFTLIGDIMPENQGDEATRGLIKPLNLLSNGTMEGVNSIIFKANVENSNVVIKCMIPLSDGYGYEGHFSSQEFEFSIPMSLPPHPNVIPILHQFTASSVLVYPWISKDLRDINKKIREINGKGIIKRQTTYVVLDYYPSTLRRMKQQREGKFNEMELMLIALQLFKGVSHLSEHKVAHRDLKDDNVFLQKDGTLTIADFGCAIDCNFKLYIGKEDIANRIGAPAVTAPEVFYYLNKGPKKINHETLWEVFEKSDVFSIGVMLYRLVDISALPSFSNKYTNDDIPLFSSSLYSNAFIAFMRSLLSYHPRDRPTAKEAVKKLEILLFGPKEEDCFNIETIENWLMNKRLDLFFNIPSEGNDGAKGLDAMYLIAHQKAMLEFFVNIESKDFVIME